PALLMAIVNDEAVKPDVRLAASERAAMRGILAPEALRKIYLTAGRSGSSAGQRAALMQQIDKVSREGRDGGRLLQLARQLLDRSRTKDLYAVAAAMLGPDIRDLRQTRETRVHAETAIEIAAASGQYDAAVGWTIFASSYATAGTGGSAGLMHWLTPVDIADPRENAPRGGGFGSTESLARQGRFSSDTLHRLVTILDGLGYTNIPIPLWEAASRTPQPTRGYLPKTGLLGHLKTAARNKETGHTLLLAVAALGPGGAKGAHLISLGDTLRALRETGLEEQAREIAFEVVFPAWPRQQG
ncbi:MAG: hypothetical protein ACR2O4_10625, partial [Hyphomicrobiaceae bacterium]